MKFFKAKVAVESEVVLNIQAEDENTALHKARKLTLSQFSEKSRISNINLSVTNESSFSLGTRIRHRIFGLGTIENLTWAGHDCWRTTVKFDRIGEKDIIIMPGKQFLEPVNT